MNIKVLDPSNSLVKSEYSKSRIVSCVWTSFFTLKEIHMILNEIKRHTRTYTGVLPPPKPKKKKSTRNSSLLGKKRK